MPLHFPIMPFLRPYSRIVFFIEHSGSSLHGTLKNLKQVRGGHLQMQNERHNGFKEEKHPTNRFNDSEYRRWSEGLIPTRSLKTQSGIQSFLGTNENLQPGCEDISLSSMGLAKKMTKAGNNMVWKPDEWKRAAKQLPHRCRLLVEELYSTVANDETRIARMGLGKLTRWAKSPWGFQRTRMFSRIHR
jgi:hypothetical protein